MFCREILGFIFLPLTEAATRHAPKRTKSSGRKNAAFLLALPWGRQKSKGTQLWTGLPHSYAKSWN